MMTVGRFIVSKVIHINAEKGGLRDCALFIRADLEAIQKECS